jgi:hypothetical protein
MSTATVLCTLIALICSTAVGAIILLFSNTDTGFAMFRVFYPTSMLLSLGSLVFLAIRVFGGHLNSFVDWLLGFGLCFVALACILYGFLGFIESKRRPEDISRERRIGMH